jgi:transcriptional regulator with XRE-family HTH domain
MMANRLRELRKAAGKTLEQVAKEANTTNQMVGMLERGDRKLTVEWMERLAPPLNAKPSDLLVIDTNHHRIFLQGEVQAGKWRSADESDIKPEYFDLPLPAAFLQLRPYALRVVGPSMNNVYPEGTILICCHMDDLQEEPITGKRYIIDNIDPSDGIETTVKEFVIDQEGRPWAWPRSNHPNHQTPLALDNGTNGHTIQIRARVVYSLRGE